MGGFEGGIRVPAIISYPKKGWTGGWHMSKATSMMDLYPIIISQIGVDSSKINYKLDGETNDLGEQVCFSISVSLIYFA